jgi:hypothetical protein
MVSDPFSVPAIEISAGQVVDNLELSLNRGGVITGQVLDASGEPVIGASVIALRPAPRPSGFSPGGAPAETRALPRFLPVAANASTNDLGEFRIFGLAAADYIIGAMIRPVMGPDNAAPASPTTMAPTYFPAMTDPAEAQPVRVESGQTVGGIVVRLVTVPAFHVSGVVVDQSDIPIADVLVRLSADPRSADTALAGTMGFGQSDARGRFTINGMTAGSYIVITSMPTPMVPGGRRVQSFSMPGPGQASARQQLTISSSSVDDLKIVIPREQ